jgi:hypothetical protein
MTCLGSWVHKLRVGLDAILRQPTVICQGQHCQQHSRLVWSTMSALLALPVVREVFHMLG